MKLEIKNLGVVSTADICLDKKLTVFCGPNGTGKTYMAYVIYALLQNVIKTKQTLNSEQLNSFVNSQSFSLTVDEDSLFSYQADVVARLGENLDSIFATSVNDAAQFFKNFSSRLTSCKDDAFKSFIGSSFEHKFHFDEFSFSIQKNAGENSVLVNPLLETNIEKNWQLRTFTDITLTCIYHSIVIHPIRDAVIFPVERNSIYTFIKELSLSRVNLIDHMQKVFKKEEVSPFDILSQFSKRYPVAIKDGLKVADDLSNISKLESPYKVIAEEIERDLLRGQISLSKEGDVLFTSGRSKRLPIHMSASVVKTMASLVFYLKHSAKNNDLIIIDEPEMNLHPEAQVVLARIFVKLINRGLRVLISTHSDYFLREINNMIMASSIDSSLFIEEQGYTGDYLLDKSEVAVYSFGIKGRSKKVTMTNVLVDDYGFAIDAINETIDKQCQISEELYFYLKNSKSNNESNTNR